MLISVTEKDAENYEMFRNFLKIFCQFTTPYSPSKLPMRQRSGPKASPSPVKKSSGLGCCSGHFVVIWIILGIVTFGVLLGVVLKFTVS